MTKQQVDIESIFDRAVELDSPEQRQAFLEEACGGDRELRARVESLLRASNDAGSFLEKPPEGLAATIATGEFDTVDDAVGEVSLEFLTPSQKANCLGTLGQYEVIEVVGRGGMGIVLRAFDTKLNRVVAIKVMAPELAANPTAVKRFLREARAAAAVSHDHVVTIHAIHDAQRPPFIVMEFVDGQSLQDKIDRTGCLALEEILRIGMQTARGLAAAHEQGLVHRDIKPANILLENGVERVKLTDFGLARAVDDVSVTQTGQIAGTPQFMSPEQAQGHALDARSDLFSLGSVFYAMCTGRPPFRAETPLAMLRRVTDDDPRSICEVNSDVPEWLEAIIFKLLAKDPAERFQSAEEVAELLNRHLAHLQHPTTAPKPERILPPIRGAVLQPAKTGLAKTGGKPARRRVPWGPIVAATLALIGCLAAAIVAGVVIFVRTNHGTIRVEVNDPNTTITIDDEMGISLQNADSGTMTVRAGEHKLHVRQGDLEFETDTFRVKRGEDVVVRVEFIDGKLGARLTNPKTTRVAGAGTVTTYPHRIIGLQKDSTHTSLPPVLYLVSTDGKLVRVQVGPHGVEETVLHSLGDAWRDVEGLTMADDGSMYAAVHGANDESSLFKINVATGAALEIGPMGFAEVDGLAWRFGELYAVTSRFGGHNARLLKVDPATGKAQPIGAALPLGDLDSLTFDDRGRLLTTDGMGLDDKIYQLDREGIAPPKPLAATPPIIKNSRDIEGLALASDGKLYGVTHPNPEDQGPNRSYLVRIDPDTFEYDNLGLLDAGTLCLAAGHRIAEIGTQLTPFVIRRRSGRDEQAFASLDSAVAAANNGDTIEVRGNGPFVSAPIVIREQALIIRAAEGFRPVIELSPDVKDARPLIETHAALVVEGLKLVRTPVVETDDEDLGYSVIHSFDAPLFVANCEFANHFLSIRASRSPVCEIRNCMFVQSQDALSYTPPAGGRLRMQNNIHQGNGLLHLHHNDAESIDDVSVVISHNTIVARPVWLFLHVLPEGQVASTPPVRLQFNDNIVDAVMAMIHFSRSGDLLQNHEPLSVEEMELALKRTLAWEEGRNLYSLQGGYVETGLNSQPKSGPAFSIKANDHWQRFWGIDQKGALFGRANFAGGDPRKRSRAELQLLTPQEFRLQGGPGSRAASDSRNLGIAANFVGPGDGYERWRATGEYQEFSELVESDLPTPIPTANSLELKLCLIPAGEFEMGTAVEDVEEIKATENWFFADFVSGRREAETPQHPVTISKPFEVSTHEVTVGQFRRFVEATGYKTITEQQGVGYGWQNGEWQEGSAFNWQNPGFEQSDDHPVCNVSWDDAVAFCRWLSEVEGVTYRLPTEAEWEYACRAGTSTLFSTGDDPNSLHGTANLADATLRKEQPRLTWAVDWEDGFAATAPVGSFKPNAFGLYDMHGNVWEWCQDVYDDQWYGTSPTNDPLRRGVERHVFRGGGFDNWPGFLRSADRYSSHSPTLRSRWAGFRVVREAAEENSHTLPR